MKKLSKQERVIAAIYFVWFFTHLIMLFYSMQHSHLATDEEGEPWPTTPEANSIFLAGYNVYKFLMFIAAPLILFVAYKIATYVTVDEFINRGSTEHKTGSFFEAFLNEKVKVEELTQKINELTNEPVNYDLLNQLKSDIRISQNKEKASWIEKKNVRKRYIDFQK